MNWRRYLAGVWVLGCFSVAHAALELSAFIAIASDYRLILTNAETRSNSGWISLGDTFEEHRLTRFDALGETLILERGAELMSLHLKDDRVKETDTRQRRTLTDDGASARQKREIPIWVDNWGNLALSGTAVSFDEIEGLFRTLAEVNADVVVVFAQSRVGPRENGERMRKTKNAVLGRAQEAGLKKFSSRVIDLPRETPSK